MVNDLCIYKLESIVSLTSPHFCPRLMWSELHQLYRTWKNTQQRCQGVL